MQEIIISKNMYDNLKPISFKHERLCYFYLNDVRKIFKKFPYNEEIKNNLIHVITDLNETKDLFSKEFVLPKNIVKCEDEFVGFTMDEIEDSVTLDSILKSKITPREKIVCLKKLGAILEKCNEIRKKLNDFALTDIHEENVLVDKNLDLFLIDMDSVKISSSLINPARYMGPKSLSNSCLKYKKDKNGFIIPSKETEIYNYIIIILNYLFNFNVAYISLDEFQNMLNYLESFNFDKELLQVFSKIIKEEENENPLYLLDTITSKQFKKICRHNYKKHVMFK